MKQSVMERLLLYQVQRLRALIASHDRCVVIGAGLAIIPLFPAGFLGLIVSAFNFLLLRKGKLQRSEESLISIGLVAGAINTILGLYLAYLLWHFGLAFLGLLFDLLSGNPLETPVDGSSNSQELDV